MPPNDMKPNDEEKQEELPGDNGSTPFSLPDDVSSSQTTMQASTSQQADTNVDPHEAYDEGLEGAIEVSPPKAGAVEEYNPKLKKTHNSKRPFKSG